MTLVGRRFHKRPERHVAQRDPVTPDLRAAVFARDGGCVAARMEPGHVCRDRWGMPHPPGDLGKLTLEHVKPALMLGKRGPSTAEWTVALCYGANVGVPSKELRAALRAYLATVADPHASHVDPCNAECPAGRKR